MHIQKQCHSEESAVCLFGTKIGILSGGVTGAAGGITAAVVAGLLMALIFKPKAKK